MLNVGSFRWRGSDIGLRNIDVVFSYICIRRSLPQFLFQEFFLSSSEFCFDSFNGGNGHGIYGCEDILLSSKNVLLTSKNVRLSIF